MKLIVDHGFGEEDFIDMINIYIAEMKNLVYELKLAIEINDFNRIHYLAHSMVGCSLNVGCKEIERYAQKIYRTKNNIQKVRYYKHLIKKHLSFLSAQLN